MIKLYLGDEQFNKKIQRLYAWVFPFICLMMTILLMISKAWLSALFFFLNLIFNLPLVEKYRQCLHCTSIIRFLISGLLVCLSLYITGWYL